MTYTVAAGLAVAAALAIDLVGLRTRLVLGRVFWLSYAIILVFQLLANGVLAGRGVVRYDPAAILGPRVAGAPIEDLAYGFALVLTTLAVWSRLGRSRLGQSRLGHSRLGRSRLGRSRLGRSRLGRSRLGRSRLGQSRLGQSRLGQSRLGQSRPE